MKETPIEKIYEAWTAVVDGRVSLEEGADEQAGAAVVRSSDGKKSYRVTWRDNGKVFTSTDPATYWQGYAGYPVIAVLMTLGRLPIGDEASRYSGVNWTELNARYKRDYAAALATLQKERGIDAAASAREAEACHTALRNLTLTLKRK